MEQSENLRENVDSSRLMTKLSIIGSIGSTALLALVFFTGIVFSFAGSDVFALAVIPYTLATLFGFAAMIYSLMATSSIQEQEEKRLLEQRKDTRAFNVEEDVRFTAGRSFENYKKFAPYVLAVLAALITLLFLFLFWRNWTLFPDRPLPANALHVAFVAVILMSFSVFAGAFFVGQARNKFFRWMHPMGAWLIAGFVVMLLATLASLLKRIGYPNADYYLARVLLVAFIILGVEFIINFIVEFYRPRTLETPRPVFESRLLALFTEPGGVMRNIADTLDYQFGFQVSGTWVYRFIEKALFPLAMIWLIVLWSFTCMQEVGPNEVGIEERFGKVVSEEPLNPGLYFTLPYPFGKIARYSCSVIHSVMVGPGMKKDGKEMRPEVVLWTNKHFAEESSFLVATQETTNASQEEKIKGKKDRAATSVSFLGVMMPVQYHIKRSGLIDYAYRNRDAARTLKNVGQMVATQYFASVDFMSVMSYKRQATAQALKERIQAQADKLQLGVEIVAVNFLDAHPPIEKVAPAYQDVIGAIEEKESDILKAMAYREKVLPDIEVKKLRLEQEAKSYSYMTTQVSKAESERFNKQLQAFAVMPSIYMLRAKLSLLEKEGASCRKFIVSESLPYQVYELNFEQKQRLDLIDADLGAITQ